MRILQVALVAGIDPLRTRPGGTRSYVLGLARYLASTGVEVTVIGVGGPARNEPFHFVAATADSTGRTLTFHRSLRKFLRMRDLTANVIHAQRPDDLVPFLPDFAQTALVTTIHGDPLQGIRERHGYLISAVYRRLERRGIGAAKRILFVDPRSREEFSRRYPRDAQKFVNSFVGVDLNTFRLADKEPARAAWRLEERPHILFSGRFEREKNLSLLCRSLFLCETRPILLLAGAGPEMDFARRQLVGLGHRFLGVVPHEQMPFLYLAVDATILPSTREAMPLACLESLACGTPVVATRVGRLPEIIEPGRNGFLAQDSPIEFARAIDRVIREGRAMARTCRESVERFGWDRIGPSVLRQYEEALI
jgi:glycosyltransferase involved in cell wall biosynthesis